MEEELSLSPSKSMYSAVQYIYIYIFTYMLLNGVGSKYSADNNINNKLATK